MKREFAKEVEVVFTRGQVLAKERFIKEVDHAFVRGQSLAEEKFAKDVDHAFVRGHSLAVSQFFPVISDLKGTIKDLTDQLFNSGEHTQEILDKCGEAILSLKNDLVCYSYFKNLALKRKRDLFLTNTSEYLSMRFISSLPYGRKKRKKGNMLFI